MGLIVGTEAAQVSLTAKINWKLNTENQQ